MATRTESQKIGARGHKWLSAHIEENRDWLAREQSEDFGIDLELELYEDGFKGNLLKVQVKTRQNAERKNGKVKLEIERQYLEYADSCRYPVLLVLVCLETSAAWYVWLQDWLLQNRVEEDPLSTSQDRWTLWVGENQAVQAGLTGELKDIARWEGTSQLILSLMDTMRCAASAGKRELVATLGKYLPELGRGVGESKLNALIGQAKALGDRMWGTLEGNAVAEQLYSLIRNVGETITQRIAINLVLRGDSYSRVGLNALSILYDEHYQHAIELKLAEAFTSLEPRVAYYCALREAKGADKFVIEPPDGFEFCGLRYHAPADPLNKWANRGASAILDCLVPSD